MADIQYIRVVLFNSFYYPEHGAPDEFRAAIQANTFTGKTDPGRWRPDAEAILHMESMPFPEPYGGDEENYLNWQRLQDFLIKNGMMWDSINPAVVAIYRLK